ncbi:MAG: hypothetical protein KUG78_05085 [Kangiellaceae bacterium]|nr:hypothetical protein [Kangiellaceae bacterium]
MKNFKYFVFSFFAVISLEALSNESLDKELQSRCLATFDLIENKNLESFISLMPFKPSSKELEHSRKLLDKKHAEWYQKSGGINEIKLGKLIYEKPNKRLKKRFAATKKARAKLRVLAKNYNTSTYCTFVKTPAGWFLSSLP